VAKAEIVIIAGVDNLSYCAVCSKVYYAKIAPDGVGYCDDCDYPLTHVTSQPAAQQSVQRTGLWRCKNCGFESGVEYSVCVKCKSPRR
jgi:hypothetical protein